MALVPGSPLARNYPVVARGRPIPPISLEDLRGSSGSPAHYVFPIERLARLAAQLDETLAHTANLKAYKSAGRWILALFGKEAIPLRVYHHLEDDAGITTDLAARFAGERIEALPCTQGPSYWQYIPGWKDTGAGKQEESRIPVSPMPADERMSPTPR